MPPSSVIAIDGPVAAGKTSVGRRLAQVLGYRFLDTGVLYRAVTLVASQRQLDLQDEATLAALTRSLDITIQSNGVAGEAVLVDGHDVTDQLRDAAIDQNVSLVSSHPQVRRALMDKQRQFAQGGRIVMAGRDIGTVILPDADLKGFLLASPEERARRRTQELAEHGTPRPLRLVRQGLTQRDAQDSQRATSPLRQAENAHPLNTDDTDIEGVVQRILALCQEI